MKVQGGINIGFVDPAIQLTWLDLFLRPSAVLVFNFTYLFLAVLGLCYCSRAGYSLNVVLIAVASRCRAQALELSSCVPRA